MCGENFPLLLCCGFKRGRSDAPIQLLFGSVVQNRIFEDFYLFFLFFSRKDVHLENSEIIKRQKELGGNVSRY